MDGDNISDTLSLSTRVSNQSTNRNYLNQASAIAHGIRAGHINVSNASHMSADQLPTTMALSQGNAEAIA